MPALRTKLMLVLALASAAVAWGDTYDLSWFTFDGGGGMNSTGGGFALSGTIGQPDAGPALTGGGFSLTGGFWTGAAGLAACKGDMNCDGVVNFKDINPFVAILSGTPPCSSANADANSDGAINFKDINPFVAILSGGGSCP